jgi:flagellar hook-length control protein FliK
MIQIVSALPFSVDGPISVDGQVATADAAGGFLALFAQALAGSASPGQGPGPDLAGKSVPVQLAAGQDKSAEGGRVLSPGKPDLTAWLAGHEAKAAAPALAAATEIPASATAVLVESDPVPVQELPAADPASSQSAPVDPALLAMMGQPVPTLPVAPAGQVLAPTDQDDAAEAPLDALALVGEPGAKGARDGKKMPNPVAVLAGQPHKSAVALARLTGEPVVPAEVAPAVIDKPIDAAMLPSALAATKDLPASTPLPAAANPATAGPEAALALSRGHVATALPEKAVIGMQHGLATQAWQQELGDRVVWLAGRQGQAAELILNPPSLGAVEVRLNMSGGEASAQFFSANPQVRDALEAALPKLREMMGSAGIALGEAMVSDQSFGQRDKTAFQDGGQGRVGLTAPSDEGPGSLTVRVTGSALLDYFA